MSDPGPDALLLAGERRPFALPAILGIGWKQNTLFPKSPVFVAIAFLAQAHAQVVIPSSTSTVQLQVLSPGSATFVAPLGTVVDGGFGTGVLGDASQNWQITNRGTLRTTGISGTSGVDLNSLTTGSLRLDNYGTIAGDSTSGANGLRLPNGGTVYNHVGAHIVSNGFYGIVANGAVNITNDGDITGSSSGCD